MHALLRAGPQPATEVGALVDALHSELDVVRFHAAIALGDLGTDGRPAVPALIHASLWDEEPAGRVTAAMALRKIDDNNGPLVIRALTEALGDANELICWVAAEYLGQIGPAAGQAVPALRQALQRDFRLSLIKTGVRLAIERIDPRPPAGVG
ncbi:MAG TPA: HEAT repeat domain-containing protein [Gemmataceae bacterium]|nr:HEAT repeat domain-containing protein [Gemmataceae bacterium]